VYVIHNLVKSIHRICINGIGYGVAAGAAGEAAALYSNFTINKKHLHKLLVLLELKLLQ